METFFNIFQLELGENFFNHLKFHFAIAFLLYFIPPVLAAVDLKLAISTARMLGERVRSHKLRKCLEKVTVYWTIQFAAMVLGSIGLLWPWYNLPYFTIVATLCIGFTEFFSYKEHLSRRKDGLSKIPETMQEIIEFIDKDELRAVVVELAKRRMERRNQPSEPESEIEPEIAAE